MGVEMGAGKTAFKAWVFGIAAQQRNGDTVWVRFPANLVRHPFRCVFAEDRQGPSTVALVVTRLKSLNG
ncbi:hypothetical protein GCM10010971_21310 [Silvimonas amylolytica]|uniref:Uncharacterized protein n=1 Tax=Silvimonas amylolytica TaxID=449663 RepID=A0ABQ2PLG9_9NEIS|nr:hypothetical protein GCM10010971_21310 [Silvimonas amylolytica]